tara:strand:- start:97 stop:471 length:375 start_codon:yes stop_codon:yes gene_type:complete
MNKISILFVLLISPIVFSADKVYLECGDTRFTMEPDKNECSLAGSDPSMGVTQKMCFNWQPNEITITEDFDMMFMGVYKQKKTTHTINRATLKHTKKISGYELETKVEDMGFCKVIEKNAENKL